MAEPGKFPRPDPGYLCPLCPDHEDEVFTWSATLQKPICEGCDYELWDAIVCEERRPVERLILDRLEEITDLSFDAYRLIELESTVKIMAENPDADPAQRQRYRAEISRLQAKNLNDE